MDELLKKAMSGIEDDKGIVPKITKTTTEETTSFVRLDSDGNNQANTKRQSEEGESKKAKKAKLGSEAKKEEEEEETKGSSEKVEQEEQEDTQDEGGTEGRFFGEPYHPPYEDRPYRYRPRWRRPMRGNTDYGWNPNYGGRPYGPRGGGYNRYGWKGYFY